MLDHSDPFYSSKFGLEWAEDHLTEFDREIEAFFQPDNYTTVTELDDDSSYKVLKLKLTKPMPRAIDGHAIDIVYNLRAALDQAIYSVATLHGPFKNTPYFPVRTTDTRFEDAMQKVAKFLPQEISDLVRSFKPYKGGNDVLFALHKLCTTNKHGIIRPLPLGTHSGMISGTSTGKGVQIPYPRPTWDSNKNEMVIARLLIGAEFTMDFDLSFSIVFSEIEGIDGKPAVSVLDDFLGEVDGIVMAIEAESIRLGVV